MELDWSSCSSDPDEWQNSALLYPINFLPEHKENDVSSTEDVLDINTTLESKSNLVTVKSLALSSEESSHLYAPSIEAERIIEALISAGIPRRFALDWAEKVSAYSTAPTNGLVWAYKQMELSKLEGKSIPSTIEQCHPNQEAKPTLTHHLPDHLQPKGGADTIERSKNFTFADDVLSNVQPLNMEHSFWSEFNNQRAEQNDLPISILVTDHSSQNSESSVQEGFSFSRGSSVTVIEIPVNKLPSASIELGSSSDSLNTQACTY